MSNFKILIVEDEVLIAEDLKDSLEELGYDVCSVCYNSEKAVKELYRCQPDLALLDITIRGSQNGIDLGNIINKNHEIPFIYLTSHSDKATLDRAKVTRPYGYIVKPFKDSDLSSSIQIALFNHGEFLRRKRLDISYVNQVADPALSRGEYNIFMDMVDGLNNRQIGEKRFKSINTIKTYIKRIFEKLGVNERVSAVKKVISQ